MIEPLEPEKSFWNDLCEWCLGVALGAAVGSLAILAITAIAQRF